ncbi:MAG: sterol desaturase family protein [Henriciella sp.]|nr:sterol desaturase family protein [Henriciella sp.]
MTEELLFAAFGALKGYLIPFVIFTLIGLVIAGRDAVRWSSDLLASVRSNIFLSIFNPMLAPLMMIGVVLTRQGYDAMGLPQTPLAFWDQVPLWLTILIWVVAIDFIDYWVHRLLHTRGFWDVHAVHHSDETMNWTTSSRMHILEVVVMQVGYILLASWLNIPAEGVGAIAALRLLHNNWVHTKYDIHLGPLVKVISTPRFHHWHHADDKAAYDTNFANTFALWDVMFGTYRVPGPYKGAFGFEGTPGNDILKLLLWPYLQWTKAAQSAEQKKNILLTP